SASSFLMISTSCLDKPPAMKRAGAYPQLPQRRRQLTNPWGEKQRNQTQDSSYSQWGTRKPKGGVTDRPNRERGTKARTRKERQVDRGFQQRQAAEHSKTGLFVCGPG